jgi:hypothetical protein
MTPQPRDVVVIVAFGVAFLVTLLTPWWGRDRLAASAVVDAARATLPALVEPGDLVLVHPPWRDDVVAALRAPGAVNLPAGVVVTEAFTRRHGDPWPALVVLAEGVHTWPASVEARRRALGVDVTEVGGLRLFRLPGDTAPKGAVDVESARVRVERGDGSVVPCPWDAGRRRHVCRGLGPWMTVGQEAMQIAGRKADCIWSHPITGGRLVIDYGRVDVGTGLTFEAALSDVAAGNPEGAPVTFTVRIDDSARTVTVHRARGFAALPITGNGVAHVVVEVATANDGQRHACHRFVASSAKGAP